MSLLQKYEAVCHANHLTPDTQQINVLDHLEKVRQALETYERKSFLKKFLKKRFKGLYIHGSVGRGKSFLMDLFYDDLSVQRKRRVHFHAFMKDMHARLQVLGDAKAMPLETLIHEIASTTSLLCLDEFMVTSIADAMVLKSLFEGLFARGVTVVATSNTPPKDLYKGGFGYELFEPFIPVLEDHMTALVLEGQHDYRSSSQKSQHLFQTDAMMKKKFYERTGEVPIKKLISLEGRAYMGSAAQKCLWTSYHDLCEKDRGPKDYMILSDNFNEWFLEGLPILTPNPAAVRFKTLIDILYDQKTMMWMSSSHSLKDIFQIQDPTFLRTKSRVTQMLSNCYD